MAPHDPIHIPPSVVSLWYQKDLKSQNVLRTSSLKNSKGSYQEGKETSLNSLLFDSYFSKDDKYLDQPSGAFGTGFYFEGKDKKPYVLTAGHCILNKNGETDENWIKRIRFVFGFRLDDYKDQNQIIWKVESNRILKGTFNMLCISLCEAKRVVEAKCSYSKESVQDFAIIELEKAPPTDFPPLPLKLGGSYSVQSS